MISQGGLAIMLGRICMLALVGLLGFRVYVFMVFGYMV